MTAPNGRRVNYENRMRQAGFVKVTVWASAVAARQIKALAAASRVPADDG